MYVRLLSGRNEDIWVAPLQQTTDLRILLYSYYAAPGSSQLANAKASFSYILITQALISDQCVSVSMHSYRDEYCVSSDSGLPEAKAWLAEHGRQMHPAFSLFSHYDDQRAQLTTQKRRE